MNDIMTTVTVPVGNIVICDACSGDFTESDAIGGMICGAWAVCPVCTPTWSHSRFRDQKVLPVPLADLPRVRPRASRA